MTLPHAARLVCLLPLVVACGTGGKEGPGFASSPDAAVSDAHASPSTPPDAAPSSAPDAATVPAPLACACAPDEKCQPCYEKIGACCGDDPTFGGQIARVVENCERDPGCRACCDECAARDCETIRRSGDCPVPVAP